MTSSPHIAFLNFCGKAVTARPWIVLGLCAIATFAAAYSATTIRITSRYEAVFPADIAFVRDLRAYEQVFSSPRDAIVTVIDGPTPARTEAAAQAIAERLREQPSLFAAVELPAADPYFKRAGLLFLPLDTLKQIQARLDEAGPAFTLLAQSPNVEGLAGFLDLVTAGLKRGYDIPPSIAKLLGDFAEAAQAAASGRDRAVAWDTVIGASGLESLGKRHFVLIHPVMDNSRLNRASEAIAAVRRVVADAAPPGSGITVRLTGEPALNQQELDAAFSGAVYASFLSFALVVLTLVVAIRSWRMVALLSLAMAIGGVWTSGLTPLVGELNLISLAFGVLFFAIGVDFGTHLGLRYLEQVRDGAAVADAIRGAISGEGPAILLSILCAAIGFLSFVPTDYRGLAQLGVISALGMLSAAAMTLFLLPAMIAVWPPRPQPPRQQASRFGALIRGHAALIVALAGLVTLAAAFTASRARIDANPLNLHDPNTEPVLLYRELARDPSTSPYDINLVAANRDAAAEIASKLRGAPGVAQVRTIDSFVPSDQEAKREAVTAIKEQFEGADSGKADLDAAELAVAIKQLDESARGVAGAAGANPPLRAAATAFAAALTPFLAADAAPDRLARLNRALTGELLPIFTQLGRLATAASLDDMSETFRRGWVAPDGRARVQVLPTAETAAADLTGFAERVQAIAPSATGSAVLIRGAADVVKRSFLQAVIYTVAGIAALLLILRRRLSDVALILLPLAVASIWTIAATTLLGLTFNFANVIAIPVLLGTGVASCIHVVARARDAERAPGEEHHLLESSTPLAVLLTDANTALAVITLAISSHRGLFSLGVLLAVAVTMSLIASLVLLPAILTLMERRRARIAAQGARGSTAAAL